MSALDLLTTWRDLGVTNVAAAVVGPEGVRATHGDTGRSFRLASVTKLLSTYAALVALEEQAIDLHAPAGPPGATVEHLLAHTAGYGFDSDADVIARPGTRRVYSNRGFEEVAAHVGAETGIDFGTYLAEAVLDPLDLRATELHGSAAYAATSTVDDLAVFAQELLTPHLVAASTRQEAIDVRFPGLSGVLPGLGRFNPLDWGLGFERNFGRPGHWAGSLISPSAFGHFGAAGTFLWVDPERNVALVCLTDLDFGDWAKGAWPALTDAVLVEPGSSARA